MQMIHFRVLYDTLAYGIVNSSREYVEHNKTKHKSHKESVYQN